MPLKMVIFECSLDGSLLHDKLTAGSCSYTIHQHVFSCRFLPCVCTEPGRCLLEGSSGGHLTLLLAQGIVLANPKSIQWPKIIPIHYTVAIIFLPTLSQMGFWGGQELHDYSDLQKHMHGFPHHTLQPVYRVITEPSVWINERAILFIIRYVCMAAQVRRREWKFSHLDLQGCQSDLLIDWQGL